MKMETNEAREVSAVVARVARDDEKYFFKFPAHWRATHVENSQEINQRIRNKMEFSNFVWSVWSTVS